MEGNDAIRWIVAAVAAAAIVGLLLFAAGQPDHQRSDAWPMAAVAETTA